ncbi:MAG: hypothetical protein NTX56_07515, partial [Proteobacteria bacterium]|nr:hypothetical protein [Pseudomonadota bacterium]
MSVTPELKATILHLYDADKWRIGTIVSQLHISRTTVANILAQAGLLDIQIAQRAKLLEPYWPFIRQILEKFPSLPASRLYDMVRMRGYVGGSDHFRHIIALHRQMLKPEMRIETQPLASESQNRNAREEKKIPTPDQKCKPKPPDMKGDPELEAEILHAYHIYGWPTGTIASQLKVHPEKVDRVIAEAGYSPHRRVTRSTYITPFEQKIEQILKVDPVVKTESCL